jgi:hypothetical protein
MERGLGFGGGFGVPGAILTTGSFNRMPSIKIGNDGLRITTFTPGPVYESRSAAAARVFQKPTGVSKTSGVSESGTELPL